MGMGGQCRAPTTLPWKDTWFPLYGGLGGQAQQILPPVGFNLWTFQPITSCYILNIKITCFFAYKVTADPGGCAAYGSGLQVLDCWEHTFVSCVCCVGSSLCDEPTAHSEESYCARACVLSRNMNDKVVQAQVGGVVGGRGEEVK